MSQRRKIHEEILEKLNGRQKKLPLMLQRHKVIAIVKIPSISWWNTKWKLTREEVIYEEGENSDDSAVRNLTSFNAYDGASNSVPTQMNDKV